MPRRTPNFFQNLYRLLPRKVQLAVSWFFTISFVVLVALALFIAIIWLALQARGMVEQVLRERLVSNITAINNQSSGAVQVNNVPVPTQTQTQTQTGTEAPPPLATGAVPSSAAENGSGLVQPGEDLVVSSFTDLFSGVGWINQSSTTLYQDVDMTAFMLPPLFTWQTGGGNFYNSPIAASDGTVTSCIRQTCLVQDGLSLYVMPASSKQNFKTGVSVSLPSIVDKNRLSNVSIGMLDTTWLVGTVERTDAGYVGRMFFLPLTSASKPTLTPVFGGSNPPFTSQYVGTIGFGGSDSDFLAIYGAYEGQGYHIQNGAATNISRFFGVRVMENGFYPVAFRSGGDWYVWSLTRGTPKFIKLFQNGTDEIVGGVDLSKELFPSSVDLALFAPAGTRTFIAQLTQRDGEQSFSTFVDKGFDKSTMRQVVSANVSNYPAEVVRAIVDSVETLGYGGTAALYMKNGTNETWTSAAVGNVVTFQNPHGRQLFWEMTFVPDSNPFTSPYLDTLELGYAVRFL